MGVDTHEDLPEKIATIDTNDAKRGENANPWPVAKRADCERDGERAEDIGGDLGLLAFMYFELIASESLRTR